MKMREPRAELAQLGCESRQGKGSHEVWYHPHHPGRQVVINGTNGKDAVECQVRKVRKFIKGMMVYK